MLLPLLLRWRLPLMFLVLLPAALLLTGSLTAQQPPPFDEAQIVANMTRELQLDAAQAERLREIMAAHRPQFERLQQQARGIPGNGAKPEEVRAAFERERRAVADELLPALRPEQQARLRTLMNPPGPPASMIAPLKPRLPEGPLAGEKLIAPVAARAMQTRQSAAARSSVALTEDQKILHLLNRAGFGPRPGDIERVRRMGISAWLDEQLHPERIADELVVNALASLGTLQQSTPEILQAFAPPPPPRPTPTPAPKPENKAAEQTAPKAPTPAPPRPPRDQQQPLRELQQAKLLRAVYSERQLQEVMTDFWINHFNVFAAKDADRWLLTAYERDVIRPRALGRFKDLLLATAQSPAMLFYLDNHQSRADNAQPPRLDPLPKNQPPRNNNAPAPRRPGLNENYGRELMELHTLGVDGGYTQQDVIEVARCFTGWALEPPPAWGFVFRPWWHDRNEKNVLGTRIPAGGGIEDGLQVIDLLARHPSTARFISRKLCQRFVADDPPETLVSRVTAVFTKTDGDIREVVRAILTSPEFNSPKYYQNKIKSPLELVASSLRATAATTDGFQPLIQWVARLGEPLYLCQPPTGFSEDSSRWINTGTLLERMNFAVALVQNRIPGTRPDLNRMNGDEAPVQPNDTINRLIALLIHSDVSPETRTVLNRQLNESGHQVVPAKFESRAENKITGAQLSQLVTLLLGSREFQVK
ncbi:MAG: DUF1800 family protein [Blastocatellia bacterium]